MGNISGTTGCAYVKLRENLVFGKTYYVSLWLRAPGCKWTTPTPAGMDSVHVPMFTWQAVSYFANAVDTVFAFNDSLRFTNTLGDLSKTDNTVMLVKPDTASLAGFIPVSVEFEFTGKSAGAPFYVGLKLRTLPAGYTMSDVRIYQRNADGLWLLDPDPYSVDSARKYVQVLTNDLDYPFIAMIDTMWPTMHVLSDTISAVPPDVAIKDTISISDNIANLRWWFKSTKGDQSYATGDTSQFGVLMSTTSGQVIVTIPRNLVSQDNGVRGTFTVSDGVHFVTKDLSRRVFRDSSDLVWTEDQKWVPLSVNADLDTPDTKKVLRSFVKTGEDWKYDKTKFRIFRWYPNTGNVASKTDKWVEYADTLHQAFEFNRGNLIWVKTRTRTAVRFGKGVTAPLNTSYVLTLQPGQFTDFSLPFKFDITVGDILRRTRASMVPADTLKTDSLLLYVWKRDNTGHYYTDLRFSNLEINPQFTNSSQTCSPDSGYTIDNLTHDTIRLQVPPIPQAMSGILSKKKAATGGWAVRLVPGLSDGSLLSPVYCGYAKGMGKSAVSYYPVAPSFGNAFAGVYERESGTMHGHAVVHSVDSGGAAFLLAFCNYGTEPAAMQYHLENLSMLPKGMSAAIYDDNTGRYEDLSKGELKVSVGADAKVFRWLFVGTQGYLAKASAIARPEALKLFGTYPNPFSSMVHIRYCLPYDGVDKVRFAIYDMRGRSVWQKEISAVSKYGMSDVVWNGRAINGQPVAAGVYILRMTAVNSAKKPAGVFEKKMTFMP